MTAHDTTDLARRLDRAIGEGPAPAEPDQLVARGRAALRRRRLRNALAVAAAVAVASGSVAVAAALDPDAPAPTATAPPASTAAPSAGAATGPSDPSPRPLPASAAEREKLYGLAGYNGRGKLVLDPRATVLERVENPYDVPAPGDSLGLVLSYHRYTLWFALATYADDSTARAARGAKPDQAFADWLAKAPGISSEDPADHTSATGDGAGDGAWPGIADLDLVRFAGPDSEALVPVAGVTVLAQRPHVDVGTSFAAPSDDTAVARVRSPDGVFYVLARRSGSGPAQYIAVRRADGGADLDAFLDLARSRYSEGGGGLL